MSATNGVAFFANKVFGNYTKSSQPTVEGNNATDSLGDAVADGALVTDVLDTQRKTRVVIDDDGEAATFRFDLDLDAAIDADFAVIDNHSIRHSYNKIIRKNIIVWHDTNGTFNGSTAITPSKHFSGLIGKEQPYLDFDGSSGYVSIPNNSKFNALFYQGGSIEFIIYPRSDGQNSIAMLFNKEGAGAGWYIRTEADDGTNVKLAFFHGFTTTYGFWKTDVIIPLNEWSHVTFVYDRDSSANDPTAYINGVSEELTEINTPVGTALTDTDIDFRIGNSPAGDRTYDGCLKLGRLWNRNLTAAEALVQYNRWMHTEVPLMNQWGNQIVQSSGTLEIGQRYKISIYVSGDDFTNVGASANISGIEFNATGTTPTAWINGSYLNPVGCVIEFHPDGINPGESKWYDTSTNDIDGTISGAAEKDCPTSVNGEGDFTLYEFTEVEKQYWFWRFNYYAAPLTADADTEFGQIGLGKKFEVAIEPNLPVNKDYLYDGISLNETQTGRRSSNERYGRRLRWGLNWSFISEAERINFETFFETIKGKKYPFWFTLNYYDNEPVFYWARLVNNPRCIPQADGAYAVNLIIEEEI